MLRLILGRQRPPINSQGKAIGSPVTVTFEEGSGRVSDGHVGIFFPRVRLRYMSSIPPAAEKRSLSLVSTHAHLIRCAGSQQPWELRHAAAVAEYL
jgi:hypothetical protein